LIAPPGVATVDGMGAPVVLVHRAGGLASEWDEVRAILAGSAPARAVLAVDLPGRGRSGGTHPERPEALAEFVVDQIIGMGRGPAVLAGHSMGGAVSLQAALDFPAWVRGIVLVASSPELRLARELARSIDEGHVLTDPEFAGQMLSPSIDERRRAELTRRMAAVPASVLRSDLVAASRLALRDRLGELGVPVRIVAGRDDRLVSTRKAMILRDALAGSTLRIVDGAGHMLLWEAAGVVAEEIEAMVGQVDDAA
jgi:pimeloyl-ACP methyl ester carboxylesterase